MTKLIIHMGAHKTASSSFQWICRNNQDLLKSCGLLYPIFGTGQKFDFLSQQHSFLAQAAQKNKLQIIKESLKLGLKEANANNCRTVIFSGEDFENFLIDITTARDFENLSRSVGYSEIQYIMVVRNPFEYANSIYNEKSKHGCVLVYDIFMDTALKNGYATVAANSYNYFFIFDQKRYQDQFSKYVSNNIKSIEFDKFIQGFAGRPILDKILNSQAINQIMKSHKETHENKSMSFEQVEIRYVCNFLKLECNQAIINKNKSIIAPLVKKRIDDRRKYFPEAKENFKKFLGNF